MGSAVSVQFQIVPCSSLYLFSRPIGPLQHLDNVNYRVLISCTCHFQSSSLFSVYFGFLCFQASSMSNFHPDTRWRKVVTYLGSLVQLCCVEGRIMQTNIAGVCGGVLALYAPHWVCPSSSWHVLPGSTLLRLQGGLQGHCPKWALCFVHFPGPSCSGFQVICKCTGSVGRAFCALLRSRQLRQPGVCEHTVPGEVCVLITSPVLATRFPKCAGKSTISGVPHVSSEELISGCDPPGGCQLSRTPGRRG